jgi:hypothetical protein
MSEDYTIEEHQHRYAAWAASRGASTKNCRFTVETGKLLLEDCDFDRDFRLPPASQFDDAHRKWRQALIKKSKRSSFTHGVAAKLINLYLKARFVFAGSENTPQVRAIHPPIDSLLLHALAAQKVGENEAPWKSLAKLGWSNFDSRTYEKAIEAIKKVCRKQGLWTIEEHWKGHQ